MSNFLSVYACLTFFQKQIQQSVDGLPAAAVWKHIDLVIIDCGRVYVHNHLVLVGDFVLIFTLQVKQYFGLLFLKIADRSSGGIG